MHKVWIKQSIDLMHWRQKGSHLHNNDASLVSRSAHVLCWQCALALSLSVRGPGRASPAVWLAGFAPPGCMLGDDARGSVSFDPQRSWAPFCDVICIWSIEKGPIDWMSDRPIIEKGPIDRGFDRPIIEKGPIDRGSYRPYVWLIKFLRFLIIGLSDPRSNGPSV